MIVWCTASSSKLMQQLPEEEQAEQKRGQNIGRRGPGKFNEMSGLF